MSKIKKSISLALALLMLLSVFTVVPLSASAETYKNGDWEYEVNSEGTTTITKYNGSDSNVEIPENFDEKIVTSIDDYAFSDCINIETLTIPKSILEIEQHSFWTCTGLKTINVDSDNPNYSSLDGNLYNKDQTELIRYSPCKSDTSFTVPESVTRIGDFAFYKSLNLSEIILNESLTNIGASAFVKCTNIKELNIPKNVYRISWYAFGDYEKISVDPENQYFTSLDGNLYNKDLTLLCRYATLKKDEHFVIPESVKYIWITAFQWSYSLKNITIPKNADPYNTFIGYIFDIEENTTKKVEGFTIYGYKDSPAEKYAEAEGFNFIDLDNPIVTEPIATEPVTSPVVTEPAQTKPDVKQQNPVQVSAEDVNIDLSEYDGNDAQVYPLTVTDAQGEVVYSMVSGDEEFFSVNESTGALIISAETEEGEYTVKIKTGALGNENYKSKYITKTITVYVENNQVTPPETDNIFISGDYKYRILSDGTAEITNYTGSDANVEIPETIDGKAITSIDFYAFGECTNIESVKIPENVKFIDWHAFYGCTNLNNITIPDTVISINNGAFDDTAYVKNESNRENGLLYIGKHLIDGRNVSGECIIKDNTITVSDMAFIYNTDITRVTFPESLKRIGDQAFNGCKELREVILPENIQEIDNLAFAGCTGLTEVILPKDIKEIGDLAFGSYPFYPGGDRVQYYKIDGFKIYGYKGTAAETYAKDNGFEFIDLDNPIVTEPIATEPVTPPVVTEPTQPNVPKPTTAKVTNKKENPIKVTVKAKTVKLKKLKKKAQKVKAIKVKNAQGKVTFKLVKSGITKKIRKLVKIGSNGVLTIKKWKKAKKGTYKIKVKITAAGTSAYNAKTITKTIKVKIK